MIKQKTAHKTTHTIYTLHRMKIQQSQLQLYKVKLISGQGGKKFEETFS
jgi:hypothetical protein